MGRRGPQPKPTALRVLHGDRKDRINTDEPQPREGLPTCPREVDPAVRKVWDYTIAELAQMKVVTPADRDPLLAYCEAVVLHRRASAMLADAGFSERALNGGSAKHPAVSIQRDAAATMRAYAQEFGLTPSSRSGIRTGGAAKADGAARLLSG